MSKSVLPDSTPAINATVVEDLTELEATLAAGLDDIDAGRIVSADESRREVEALLAKYETLKTVRQ